MRNFFKIFLISFFLFLSIDWFFGNKILDFLHKKEIILSEEKKIERNQKKRNEEKKYRIKNDFYHHSLKENAKFLTTWGKNKYYTCTDGHGFRKYCSEKNNNEKDIILIGDSFTEGIGLEYYKTFAGMLSSKLNDRVYNMGVSSYSPIIYKNKIKYHIQNGLNIKHVIVFLDISDIDDATNYVECNNKVCRKQVQNINKTNITQIKEKKLLPLLDLFKLFFKNIKRSIKPEVYIYRKDFLRSNWTFIEENENIKLGIKNSINHMNELYQFLKDKNISLSVAVYPHPGQILHDQVNSKQVIIWNEFCKNKCKYFINYFPLFFEKLKDQDPKKLIKKYYIKNDVHFNYNGNTLLFEKLKELNF